MRAYDAKQTDYRAWCRTRNAEHSGQFVLGRAETQRVYGAARESHNERTRNTVKHSTCSHTWWESWKSRSLVWNLLFLLSGDLEVVWWWLLLRKPHSCSLSNSQWYSKQCHEQFVTPLSCFPQSGCNSLAFRTSVLLRLLHDLDTYGGVFPLFLKTVADIIDPKLSIIFRRLIRLGSFPECWRSANVTAISKGAPFPDTENYRPLSITPILSQLYEKLVFHKIASFGEKYGILPAAQFSYRKGQGCADLLFIKSYHIQN